MDWLIWLVAMPVAVVTSTPLGMVATFVTYLVLVFGGFEMRRAIAYACFFLASMTVAKFQWHIAFAEDRSGLVQYYFEAILLVPLLSVIGLLFSLRYLAVDRFLGLIIGMTVLLGLMQGLAEANGIPAIALNLYARAYAVAGMSLPFVSVGWNRYAQRSRAVDS